MNEKEPTQEAISAQVKSGLGTLFENYISWPPRSILLSGYYDINVSRENVASELKNPERKGVIFRQSSSQLQSTTVSFKADGKIFHVVIPNHRLIDWEITFKDHSLNLAHEILHLVYDFQVGNRRSDHPSNHIQKGLDLRLEQAAAEQVQKKEVTRKDSTFCFDKS